MQKKKLKNGKDPLESESQNQCGWNQDLRKNQKPVTIL